MRRHFRDGCILQLLKIKATAYFNSLKTFPKYLTFVSRERLIFYTKLSFRCAIASKVQNGKNVNRMFIFIKHYSGIIKILLRKSSFVFIRWSDATKLVVGKHWSDNRRNERNPLINVLPSFLPYESSSRRQIASNQNPCNYFSFVHSWSNGSSCFSSNIRHSTTYV
jgi:hypothetical protein